jgi:hypothetical protein
MPRWERVDELTPFEEFLLKKLVKSTPGMTRYGNKVRVSVMLPVELALKVSKQSLNEEKTVSEVIVKGLCEKYKK